MNNDNKTDVNYLLDKKYLSSLDKKLDELSSYKPNDVRCLMLTKEQSFKYFIDKGINARYIAKHNVVSAVHGKCLGCGKDIVIPFDAKNTKSVYCDACQPFAGSFPDKELPHLMRYKSLQLTLLELRLSHSPSYIHQILEELDSNMDECNVMENVKDKAWVELRAMKKAKTVVIKDEDLPKSEDIKENLSKKIVVNRMIVNKISI